MLAWDHFMGDWRDAKNIAQGDDPYATASVVDDDQGKFVEWDATGLVRDWVDEKHQNQGFFEHAMVRRGYSKRPVLLGQSRGGLMMLAWAMRRPESVGAFAGIYPVCNLESWPLQRSLASTLKDYGMDEAALRAKIKTYNPIDNLAGLAAAGVPLFFIHGDSDPLHGRPQLQHE
jgi:pimeloyl-ACP methyl ester carboxylesterase